MSQQGQNPPSVKFSAVILRNESAEEFEGSIITTRFFGLLTNKKIPVDIVKHEQKRLQSDDNGSKFRLKMKRKRDGAVIIDQDIYTCQLITVDLTGEVQHSSLQMPVANQNARQRLNAFIENMKKNDYYKILRVSRNATQEEIHKSFLQLVRRHHPDRNNNSIECTFMTQKLVEADTFLSDSNNRSMYNKFLDYQGGFFSVSRWRSFFADHHRWPYLFLTIPALVAGIVLTIVSAPALALTGLAAGGALISSGMAGTRYVISQEAALKGVEIGQLGKILIVHGAFGAAVGVLGAGVGQALPGVVSQALSESASQLTNSMITGVATGAITGGAGGVCSVVSQAISEDRWKDMSAGACVLDLVTGAAVGVGTGAALGACVGAYVSSDVQAGSVGRGLANTGVDEAAGNIAGAGQDVTRVTIITAKETMMSKTSLVQIQNNGNNAIIRQMTSEVRKIQVITQESFKVLASKAGRPLLNMNGCIDVGSNARAIAGTLVAGIPALSEGDDNVFPNAPNSTTVEATNPDIINDDNDASNNIQTIHNVL